MQWFADHVRVSRNHVIIQKPAGLGVLGRHHRLVVEVAHGSGQGEHAVHSTVFNAATSFDDTLSLFRKVGLVVLTELDCVSSLTHYSSGVAGIGTVDFGTGDKHNGSRATSLWVYWL